MTGYICSCTVRGSINCDEYFHVTHIVRPGETISSYGHQRRVGGKGANQAAAIVRAGGQAQFYGTIGDDGLWVKDQMRSYGINVNGIIVSEELSTGRAIIQVDDQGENSIVLFPGANHATVHEDRFMQRSKGWFPETTHLLLQNEISPSSNYYALHRAVDATVIMNPSPLPSPNDIREYPWNRIDWLIVNESEAHGLYRAMRSSGTSATQSPIAVMPNRDLLFALSVLPKFENINIVCTLGADGVLAFLPTFHRPKTQHETASFMYLPAAKLMGGVKDTTGAGDCFTGFFVQGLMEFGPIAQVGKDIREHDIAKILKISVYASGMCVERSGTIDSIPTRAEVEERMSLSMSV